MDKNIHILNSINSQQKVDDGRSSQFNKQKDDDNGFIKTKYYFCKKNLQNNQNHGLNDTFNMNVDKKINSICDVLYEIT